MKERLITYPSEWEVEYRRNERVARWRREFPSLFKKGRLSSRLGTLDLFAQYALQYLLARRENIKSLTWYKLGSTSPTAVNRRRTDAHWKKMRVMMGDDFPALQNAILKAGLKDFTGEPDLFCWNPADGRWFFAEAKRKDVIHSKQRKWFRVCHQALGERADIRIYKLEPEEQTHGRAAQRTGAGGDSSVASAPRLSAKR